MNEQLSDEQIAALRAFRAQHGQVWKYKLLELWRRGDAGTDPVLQQLGDTLGIDWLIRYKPAPSERSPSARPSPPRM